jgi:glycosyltransferase involved in cell wall biosynthesis
MDFGSTSIPLVSVVMAVYNGEDYLREAIDSLVNQTLTDTEIVVIDDGATDKSPEILASYGDRLRVVRQANQGQTRALNHGLRLARGKYIARMDQDDVAEPQRLQKQAEFMEAHPQIGLLGSAYHEMDAQGRIFRTIYPPTGDPELRRTLAKYCPFMHSAMMFRRDLLAQTGDYTESEQYRHFQDLDLWIRLAQHSQIDNLPEPLMRRRVHGSSASATRDNARLYNDIELRSRAIRAFNLPPWYWWYVLRARVGLWLPMPARNFVRRLMYGGKPYR